MRKSTVVLLSVLLFAVVPSCLATQMTFAQFDLEGQTFQNIFSMAYSTVGGSHNTLTNTNTTETVTFAFLPGSNATIGTGDVQADFTFTGTSRTAASAVAGGYDLQTGYSGTFAFTLATPIHGKTNLLSGTFGPVTDLLLFGGGAIFSDSTPPTGEVVFSSDFMTFGVGGQAFSYSLSNVHPPAGTLNGASFVEPFGAGGTGTFSANIIPEPMSFLLVGVGLVGLGLLRRKLTK